MSSPPPYSTSPPYYRSTLPDGGLPIASDLSTQSTSESKLPPMGPSSGSLITPRRQENATFQQSQPPAHQQPQDGDGSAANSASISCWLKIEDYATQIRIVALQARCGATISPEQVQRAHELTARMQDEIQPLLNGPHTATGGGSQFISPIPQLRAMSGNGASPARSPMLIANKISFPGVPPLGQAQAGVSPNGSFGHSPGYGSPSLGPPLDGASPMFSYTPPNDHVKPKARTKRKRSDESYRVCRTCLTTETPEWRRGPNGPRTLCNACGLKWAKKQRALKREEESPLPPPKHEAHPDLSGVVDDKDDK